MYKDKRVVQSSEIGLNDQVRVNNLVDMIQDLEANHIDSLTLLKKASIEQNFGILLNFRYVHIKRWPKYKDQLNLVTYPFDTKAFYGFRNSIIKDTNDDVMIESYCVGSFINLKTLSPSRISAEVITDIVDSPKHEMLYEGRKIDLTRELNFIKEAKINVENSHIDYYNHVNNAYYVEFAYNQIPHDFNFDTVICEYKYAFMLNEVMTLKTYQTQNSYLIQFMSETDKLQVIIEFKKQAHI